MNETIPPFPKKKLSPFQKIVIGQTVLLALLIGVIVLYWQTSANNRQRIQDNLNSLEMLDQQKQECTQLIQQNSGNFDRFQYCKILLEQFK